MLMPNIAKVLKDKIQRIARKETKSSASILHKTNVSLKKALAELRKELAAMKSQVRQLIKIQGKQQKTEPVVTTEGAAEKLRFSSKGIRSLRRKLKLSQADFAKLAGVSSLAVYQWERNEGKLALRQTTRTKLAEIRGLGRREALERLGKDTVIPKEEKSSTPVKRGGRRVGEKLLVEYIQKVLMEKKAGMEVKDIAEAVQKIGYKTTSKNFSNVITVFCRQRQAIRESPSWRLQTGMMEHSNK